jgi:hypothetical protein
MGRCLHTKKFFAHFSPIFSSTYSHELTLDVDPKASWVDDWSGVLPEKPRAGVLNWDAVGAVHEPSVLGVK